MTRSKDSELAMYTVTYDSSNHIGVLFQMWGSIWPKVLPYCIFNVVLMGTVVYIKEYHSNLYPLQFSSSGHSFLTVVVAFLLVSRVNIALGRFNEGRSNLGTMYRETRELIQNACVFSEHATSEQAKAWRHKLAYQTMLLLRVTMAVIDYPTDKVPAWDLPELQGEELEDIQNTITSDLSKRWAHSKRGEWEETMRVPIRLAFLLRRTIHSHSSQLRTPMQLAQENKLHSSVDSFMGGYYGMRKFMTTPVPFPLIQMARTFLFLYIFTIPFVLEADANSGVIAKCIVVFLITFGFMGLEVVAIELDNPFGDDANDFNNDLMAMTAYEDTYLTIWTLDGEESVDKLRLKMDNTRNANGVGNGNGATESSSLLSKIV